MQSVRQLMRKKAYRTFFTSFIMIFLLPVLVLAGVVIRMSVSMEQETETASRLALEQFKSSVDGQLYTVMRVADSIVVDDKSLYFAERDDPMRYLNNISTFQMLKSLTQEVGLLSTVYSDIEQCYLFLPRSGKIISNTITEASDFFNRKLAGMFPSSDEWIAFLGQQPDGFTHLNQVHYLRAIRRGEMWLMTVVVTVDSARILKNFSFLSEESRMRAAIFSQNGELLYYTRDTNTGSADDASGMMLLLADALESGTSGTAVMDDHDEAMRIHWTKSVETGCIYLTMLPESVFMERTRALRLGSILGGILLLACGFSLSLWLTRRQYRPILALRNYIENSAGYSEQGMSDDFGYLSEMLQAISDENKTISKQVYDSKWRLEQFALERLLKGMYTSVVEMEAQLLALNIILDWPRFFVICFCVDGFAGDNAQLRLDDWELIRFVVSNVFEELLVNFSAHTVICDGLIWVICGAPDMDDEWQGNLEEVLHKGCDFLHDRFEFSLSVAVSDCVSGLDGVHRAYRMAIRLLRQNEGQPDRFLLAWQTTKPEHMISAGQSLTADAQRLAQMIQDGDESGISSLMGTWKAQYAVIPYYLSHMYWCALLQMLLPLLPSFSKDNLRSIHEHIRAFVEAPLLSDDFKEIQALFLSMCRLPQAQTIVKAADIAPRVKAYIEENYRSSELNINQIAEFINLTPSYASMLYKKQAGESMLDRINRVRLTHAKRLLLQTSMGLEEVAEQTGYYNSSTFLRAFKKYEGVTPGQFRTMRAEK